MRRTRGLRDYSEVQPPRQRRRLQNQEPTPSAEEQDASDSEEREPAALLGQRRKVPAAAAPRSVAARDSGTPQGADETAAEEGEDEVGEAEQGPEADVNLADDDEDEEEEDEDEDEEEDEDEDEDEYEEEDEDALFRELYGIDDVADDEEQEEGEEQDHWFGDGTPPDYDPDGRHCLFGEPLRHAPKLLRRIFRMRQQPGQLLWASEQPLEAEAWQYLQDVFAAPRIRPLLMRGQRVLKPLPDRALPSCFRLYDDAGRMLQGPRVSGATAKPWNVGRQFFSSFSEGPNSFIWADGVRAMEPEAQADFNAYMGGSLGWMGM
uniref:Uncharacterized protein n=1 Tax=Tetradesmus obliquus TaxID=3088 RepID=A0A383VUL4_TETOB|eukprot:jgi/Sobl393_1/400/SZX68472.1